MRIVLDESKCSSLGMCESVAPDFFEVRDRALIAHATQIDPNGPFFSVPTEVAKQAWPTEDCELVRSLVDSTAPEDDLFAGIPGPAADEADVRPGAA